LHGGQADKTKNGQLRPLNFSKLGANLMMNHGNEGHQRHHSQFLKKRNGNGGSPTPGDSARKNNLSTMSGHVGNGDLSISARGGAKLRDHTTVRIRGKDNQYQYIEGSFAHPLYSVKNETARKHAHSTL
jgi:hypothetical protein